MMRTELWHSHLILNFPSNNRFVIASQRPTWSMANYLIINCIARMDSTDFLCQSRHTERKRLVLFIRFFYKFARRSTIYLHWPCPLLLIFPSISTAKRLFFYSVFYSALYNVDQSEGWKAIAIDDEVDGSWSPIHFRRITWMLVQFSYRKYGRYSR